MFTAQTNIRKLFLLAILLTALTPLPTLAEVMNFSYDFVAEPGKSWTVNSKIYGQIDGTIDPSDSTGDRVIINSFISATLVRAGLSDYVYDPNGLSNFNSLAGDGSLPTDPATMSFSGVNNNFRVCHKGFTHPLDAEQPYDCPFGAEGAGGFGTVIFEGTAVHWFSAADGISPVTVCVQDPERYGCRVTNSAVNYDNWQLEAEYSSYGSSKIWLYKLILDKKNVDTDGDGVADKDDAFQNNPNETLDSDGDGVGNNGDAFPNDANETIDSDGDGVGDNGDVFPDDATETVDTDGDGVGDNGDAFPNDPTESVDTDGDGVGDQSDNCPAIANADQTDTDGNGIGNACSGESISMLTLWGATEGGVAAIDEEEANVYQYWTDILDSQTDLLNIEDRKFNHDTQIFDVISYDDELVLNGTQWLSIGNIHISDNGDGTANASLRSIGDDNLELFSVKASARFVDIGGEAISGYLDSVWQGAMIEQAAVFATGAKLIIDYRFEALTMNYLLEINDWCNGDGTDKYVTLNNNCNGITVPIEVNTTGYAQLFSEVTVASSWIDPDNYTTPPNTVEIAWNGTSLRAQFIEDGTVNYYVVDWSNSDPAAYVSDAIAGTNWVQSSESGVEMIHFEVPDALKTLFSDDLDSSKFFLTLQNGFIRFGDVQEIVDTEADDFVFNGNAMSDILDNFSAPPLLPSLVGTWVSDNVSGGGASGFSDKALVHFFDNGYYESSGTCNESTGPISGMSHGTYQWDSSTGIYTVNDLITSTQGGCSLDTLMQYGTTLNVSGNTLTLSIPNFASFTFTRLQGSSNPIVGSWLRGDIQNPVDNTVLTFLNDNSFYLSENCTADANAGFEFGSYIWDQGGTNELSGDIFIDANGQCGLHDNAANVFSGVLINITGDVLTVGDPNTPDAIFNRHSLQAHLVCSYESGWDDTGDFGEPINPNSFAEYEEVIADCGTAMMLTAASFKGTSFISGDETLTLDDTLNAGTMADPGTGRYSDIESPFEIEWYIEDATCVDCNYSYLVVYTNTTIEPTLPIDFFRDTRAITIISGNVYTSIIYSEQSNYSDADRATGSDGEIWTDISSIVTEAIVGAWHVPSTDDSFADLILYSNGRFIYVENDLTVVNPSENGMEAGTYVYDSNAGNITFTLDYDDNICDGSCDSGIGTIGTPEVISAVLSNNDATLTLAGSLVFNAIDFTSNTAVVGAWSEAANDLYPSEFGHLILYPDGNFYFAVHYDSPTEDGLEAGTYVYNSNTGSFTFTLDYDDIDPGNFGGIGDIGNASNIGSVLSNNDNTLNFENGALIVNRVW
jgi:hypothetical protein